MIVNTENFEVGLTGQKYTIKKGTSGLEVWKGPADAPTALMVTITDRGVQNPRLEASERYLAGGGPGASLSSAWQPRQVNTTIKNTLPGSENRTGGQFLIPAGIYRVTARAPAVNVGRHVLELKNASTGAAILTGTTGYSGGGSGAQTDSTIDGYIELAAATVVQLSQFTETAVASFGLGVTSISPLADCSRISFVKEA